MTNSDVGARRQVTAAQQDWPQHLRSVLAKLPPEQAEAR